MPNDKIRVMIKEPGDKWRSWEVDNTLRTFQGLVGGYIETVTVSRDLVLIVNEEGVLLDLEPNLYACGHWLRGTIVAVGLDKTGEEFASCPLISDWQMRIAIGVESARRDRTARKEQ